MCVWVCACVRACMHACVLVCMCVCALLWQQNSWHFLFLPLLLSKLPLHGGIWLVGFLPEYSGFPTHSLGCWNWMLPLPFTKLDWTYILLCTHPVIMYSKALSLPTSLSSILHIIFLTSHSIHTCTNPMCSGPIKTLKKNSQSNSHHLLVILYNHLFSLEMEYTPTFCTILYHPIKMAFLSLVSWGFMCFEVRLQTPFCSSLFTSVQSN